MHKLLYDKHLFCKRQGIQIPSDIEHNWVSEFILGSNSIIINMVWQNTWLVNQIQNPTSYANFFYLISLKW